MESREPTEQLMARYDPLPHTYNEMPIILVVGILEQERFSVFYSIPTNLFGWKENNI